MTALPGSTTSPRRDVPRRRAGSRALATLAVGALAGTLAVPLATPAAAVDLELSGDGSSRDPYQIATPQDLLAVADAVNSAPGQYAGASYTLTADIDLGGATFPGLDTFSGVLEGAGHTVRDVVYGLSTDDAASSSDSRALVRTLTGTVRNLTLDGVSADNGQDTGYVAGVAVKANGATITGTSVLGAELVARGAEKAGGLVGEADGGTITDNRVQATIVANEMPGGVAAYTKNATTIARNLVDADLTMLTGGGAAGTRGNDAGLVVAYPGTPNQGRYTGNVALGGSITAEGKVDGFLGRIVGYTAYDGWTATDNLANATITVSGATVTGPGTKNQHGTDATAEQLAQQSTYEGLGWDFSTAWRFDDELGHPVPSYSSTLFGAGTQESPYEIATEDDLEHLAARLNAGDARYAGAKVFRLVGDLDLTGRDPFVGIDLFEGVLDGAGHTITGLRYGASDAGNRRGLVREARGATVRDLTLADVGVDVADAAHGDWSAGVAVVATDTTFDGVTVRDASLVVPGAEKVAGIAAELRGASVVRNSWVDGQVTAGWMPAGVTSYAADTAVVARNLVSAELTTVQAGGTRGVDAGLLVAYPGRGNKVTLEENVALDGEIGYEGTTAGFAGRVLGYVADGYGLSALEDNLANEEITVAGQRVTGRADDQNGADTTAAALALQETYEQVGWDFATDWTFDEALGHPVPKYVADDEAPNRVTVTVHGDTTSRRGFTWYSTLAEAPVVRLSTDRAFPEGASTVDVAATVGASTNTGEPFHQAVATDLQPGTRYYYRVGDADAQVWSATGTFVTADGEGDFTFVSLTDTQSQNVDEAALSAATLEKALATVPEAELVIHGGDVVERGDREQDWADLLDASRRSLMSTTIAPAAGNHDQATRSFVDHFALEAPGDQDTSTGAYYSFDQGSAHVAVLNTNEDGAQAVSDAQIAWLREDVTRARAAGARWIILSMHKGPYTTANHTGDGDVVGMREALVPVIDELDVDLVLQGHDHVMVRSKVLVSDPEGVAGARAVETTKITELRAGKRAEYMVDPEGTLFFLPNTAGAKHYRQTTSVPGLDLEAYLNLFDRTGEQSTENFAAIRSEGDRLTVDVYDIRDQGAPRLFESFGIDREISPVTAAVAALPAVEDLTVDDAADVAAVRADADALTSAQQGAVTNLGELEAREQRLRELAGLVSTDGSVVAWAKPDALSRQTVTVDNDTRTDMTGVPVRVRVETPDVDASTLAVHSADGRRVPHEVETWQPGGTSVLWVRVPRVAATSSTTLWVYLGGEAVENDPTAVWGEDYELVEHMAGDTAAGDARTDSTGARRGTVVGGDLAASVGQDGVGATTMGGARLEYGGDVGGDQDRISISSVYSLTPDQLGALGGNSPIVAKESRDGTGRTTLWQGVVTDGARLGTRLAGNSYEFGNVDLSGRYDLPVDGEPHLVTQTYDGMTYAVYVDGREVHSQMVEYRTTFGDLTVPTTIGDYTTEDGSLASPFTGVLDEVQIAGVAFSPDAEQFRYATLLGDAVRVGERVARDDDGVLLVVGTPRSGADVAAGLVEVTGTLSHRGELVATVGDGSGSDEVLTTTVDAGAFAVDVPVDAPGEQTLHLAVTTADNGTARVDLPVQVSDEVAPSAPHVSDDAATAEGSRVTLTATPRTDSREQVEVRFSANRSVALTAENTVVRAGTTTDRVPTGLAPTSGEVVEGLTPTTVGEDANPFQVYEISLDPEQAAQDELHLTWQGTGDDRRVSAWVYDHAEQRWRLKDSAADADGGPVALDVTALASEGAVQDGVLHLLVWRGLTEEPTGVERDYTAQPDAADFDWGFDHVPDTQLYAQATPEQMVDQFRYVADVADERKTALVIQSGDLVNREYLSQEYQWVAAEEAVRQIEDADLPFMVSWGNHDYSEARNGRVMLPKYYPMSRFEASLEGSPFTFGGSQDIDNYYYTGEIAGARLLVLTVGFFSADQAGDAGLAWARDVIAAHPDHTVILATHQSVDTGANRWANSNVMSRLVEPFDNVRLVLGGHIAGTGVASLTRASGAPVYGILTDYQSRVHGGQEYLKHLSVDAENGLLYVNTWSPMLRTAESDRHWHNDLTPGTVAGMHGADTENYVLELDLGGSTTRTLATSGLTLAAGAPEQVGEVATAVGQEPVSVVLDAEPDVAYEWFAELTDAAGNTTRSRTATFVLRTEQPALPLDVTVQPRCLAGKAYLAVRATNTGGSPVDVTLSTPFGERSVPQVEPGASAYQSFATRSTGLLDGRATVKATGTLHGDQVTITHDVPYPAHSCP